MPSNIYLSNSGAATINFSFKLLGPDKNFDSYFGPVGPTSLPGGSGAKQVMSVDRTLIFGPGRNVITMGELSIVSDGMWVGSLVLMLDAGSPIKNKLSWMIRGPGKSTTALVSDRNVHSIDFKIETKWISFKVYGLSSGVFDDVYLEVLVEAHASWTRLLTARDDKLKRVLLFALDGEHTPTLMIAPYDSNKPVFTRIPCDTPSDLLTNHAAIFESAYEPSQALWVACVTHSGNLWLKRSDQAIDHLVNLERPTVGSVASLVVSDAFTIAGQYQADIFLTLLTDDNQYRLYSRSIVLSDNPGMSGKWLDWGVMLSLKPSYVRGKQGRYLVAAHSSYMRVAVDYAYANPNESVYSRWINTTTLPVGVTTNQVLSFSWSDKAHPKTEIAVAMRGSDGMLYAMTLELSRVPWLKSSYSLVGDEMLTIEGHNTVPIIFRDPGTRTIRSVGYTVKEGGFGGGGVISDAATPACFSGFYYAISGSFEVGEEQFVVWQTADLSGIEIISLQR